MTPEERLIAALKAQNKIVFGNTIGVDGNGECTVVGEDATVRAIAGTPISAGSCVALQADNGQWYAVSAREVGTIQKRTLYKRKNKPPSSDGEGGPVKILYIKEGVFYIGGDRLEPAKIYQLPSNYELFGPASINNLGTGLNDWIVNIRLRKAGKITLISVTPETENRVEDIDIPKIYGGFGGTDPSYPDSNEGFFPDVFGLPFFRCFQNGFYTAFGAAIKRRNNSGFGFLEAAQIKYVTYYGNTLTSAKGELNYSDIQTLGIQSSSFSLRAFSPTAGESVTVTVTTYAIAPDGSLESTPHPCTYTVTSSDRSEADIAAKLIQVLESTLPDFGFYANTNASPSQIIIRGTYVSERFTFTKVSSAPTIYKKVFLISTENVASGGEIILTVTGIDNETSEEVTRTYPYSYGSGASPISVVDGIAAEYGINNLKDISVGTGGEVNTTEKGLCCLLIVDVLYPDTVMDASISLGELIDPRITLGENTEISTAIKPINQPIQTFYAEGRSQPVQVSLAYNTSSDNFFVGTDLEYTIAIGARQESVIFIKKINKQYKTLLIEGNNIREFPRAKFKNPLDSENNLTDISKYFRPNLVGQTLFNIPFGALTKEDPKTKQQIPIDSLEVFITDLSKSDPKTTKQTVSITQPDTSYLAVDVSAYIA